MKGSDLIKEAYWKEGFHLKGDPKLVAARIIEISAKNGQCTAEDILTDARDDHESPFRPTVYALSSIEAAHAYRLLEAGKILRGIYYITVAMEDGGPVEIQTPLVTYLSSRDGYVMTHKVLSDVDMRRERLQRITQELEQIQHKLRDFRVLAQQNGKTIALAKAALAKADA